MALHIQDIEHLRVGWQKVVDCGQYGNVIYVFRVNKDQLMAVTNKAQGVGELLETIHASKPAQEDTADDFGQRTGEIIAPNYAVQYEKTGNPFGGKS